MPYFCTTIITASSWPVWEAFPSRLCVGGRVWDTCALYPGALPCTVPGKLPFSTMSAWIGAPLADSAKDSLWSLGEKQEGVRVVSQESGLSIFRNHDAGISFFLARPQVIVSKRSACQSHSLQ